MNSDVPAKPVVTIDGVRVEFNPGDTIMKAAEKAGIDAEIPRFCYHPGLPVAGTCRMCTVQVEKAPKLMTACSTPCTDGMVVHTKSEPVQKSRAGVMEFLLANHPLDCPVCDQAGECSLQNYNFQYGPGTSEFQDEKRIWSKSTTKKLSEKLTLNMNRCIHCERCVRFTEDVTKSHELAMINRGWKKELVTAQDMGMVNDYQGNIADICPVGAITFNDFRFKKRVWFLKPRPSICDGCSKGCAVWADEEKNIVHRYRARRNDEVNGHWICDAGRVSFQTYMHQQRIVEPMLKTAQGLSATNWETLAPWLVNLLKTSGKTLLVIGTDATIEEAKAIQGIQTFTKGSFEVRYYNGTMAKSQGNSEVLVMTSHDDGPLDDVLRQKDQTPNTKGLESLGIQVLEIAGKNSPSGKANEVIESSYDLVIYFRSGRANIPEKMGQTEVAWGVFHRSEVARFDAVLPGLSTLEKAGSYVNSAGKKQVFAPAVSAKGSCAAVGKILEGLAMVAGREVAVGV